MTNPFIEKLAVAILSCDAAGPITLSAARVVVRAVLASARDRPNIGMLIAGQSEIYIERNENPIGPHTYASRDETEAAWQAMIDEALKP